MPQCANNVEVDVFKSLKWSRDFHPAVTTVGTNNFKGGASDRWFILFKISE